MEVRGGIDEKVPPTFHLIPEEIFHNRVGVAIGAAERQAGDRPDALLELRNDAGIDRPVTGIVGSWREFINEKPAVAS